MIDIKLFCQALTITCIKTYINPLTISAYIARRFDRTVRIWIRIGNASELPTVIFTVNVKSRHHHRDNVKREISTKSYEDGGLKMIDIIFFLSSINNNMH
jgi:hypothetical protein